MSWAHPTPRKRSKPDGSIEIQGMTYGGIWSISTPPGFSGIKKGVKKEYRLYAHKKGKKADYTIFLVGDEQHEITNESAYILRDDIERLYASIETGEFPLAPSFLRMKSIYKTRIKHNRQPCPALWVDSLKVLYI